MIMPMLKEASPAVVADSGLVESEAVLASFGLTSKIATRHLNFYYDDNQALFDK